MQGWKTPQLAVHLHCRSAMAQMFTREPLAEPTKEIRLLRLEPHNSNDDEIRCNLFIRRFEPRWIHIGKGEVGFDYNAISYSWGEKTESHYIRIHSKRLPVTKNCHYALLQARKHHSWLKEPLWIDAICINQDDQEEKSKQVYMMADIYACASNTLISLGAHEQDSKYFCRSHAPSRAEAMARSRGSLPRIDEERLRRAALAFFKRSYWTRAWVIQELAFSRNEVCMCGEDILGLLSVENFINSHCSDLVEQHEKHLSSIMKLLNQRQSITEKTWTSLQTMLSDFRSWVCSDPRDRVFSLIGMQPPAKRLRPDYSLSRYALAKRVLSLSVYNPRTDAHDPNAAYNPLTSLYNPLTDMYNEKMLYHCGSVLTALHVDLNEPGVLQLCKERLQANNFAAMWTIESSAKSKDFAQATLFTKRFCNLRRDNSGRLIAYAPGERELSVGAYNENHDLSKFAEPLFCRKTKIGWISKEARAGDLLAILGPHQEADETVDCPGHVFLVLRRNEAHPMTTSRIRLEIVGIAILAKGEASYNHRAQ